MKDYTVIQKPKPRGLIITNGTYITQINPQKGSKNALKNIIIR